MKRLTAVLAVWGGLAAVGCLPATIASAATLAERNRSAAEKVEAALESEIEGRNWQRNDLLGSALELAPDCPAARWHSGQVRHRNQWVDFGEVVGASANDHRLAAYRRRREETPDTLGGHFELAAWCAKQKLADRCRAHLIKVLEIDAEHAEARRLLGYRKIDGVWLTRQEIEAANLRAKQVAAALAEWKPGLEEILRDLSGRSQQQRDAARQRLSAIDDAAAIPAMELVLGGRSEQAAVLLVQALDRIPAHEAAMALARQAVFSPSFSIRRLAAEKLKSRKPEGYVPALLSAMSGEVQSRAELYRAPSGRLSYRHVFYREGQEQAEMKVLQTEYKLTVLSAGPAASYNVRSAMLDQARREDAARKAQARETAVAEQNAVIQRINERIAWVLSIATGMKLPASSELWWKWWEDYNEIYVPGDKPVERSYHRDTVAFADPGVPIAQEKPTDPAKVPRVFGKSINELQKLADVPDFELPKEFFRGGWQRIDRGGPKPQDVSPSDVFPPNTLVYIPPGERGEFFSRSVGDHYVVGYEPADYPADQPFIATENYRVYPDGSNHYYNAGEGEWVRLSCLVAGTPVWTDRGPVPVEKVRVGDLVLAQDPETGELAYKPVLKTTARPPVKVIRFEAGTESVRCSGGHLFWVPGEGWVRARDLRPDAQLHCVAGTVRVGDVLQAGLYRTYNLVVADFHTYFVGKAKLLTHDNTIWEPINVVVPGLARR